MNRIFDHWFTTTNEEQIDNDTVIESARKSELIYNPSYTYPVQLSTTNMPGINWINNILNSYNQLGLSDPYPILSQDQLNNVNYLLTGDAGEQLVDQALRKLVNQTTIVFHDVLLPYQYGQRNGDFDNQIDNLVVTSTGIYCIEVKVRNFTGNYFNVKNLSPAIYQQITFHKEAVKQALQSAGYSVPNNLVKNIVVVIARDNHENFDFNGQTSLEHKGARVSTLGELTITVSEGFNQCYLRAEQIQDITRIIQKSRLPNKRVYLDNVRFKLTQQHFDKLVQMEQTVSWHLPVEQNICYAKKLNDLPMTGLNATQQNLFWIIVGRLYGQGRQRISLTANELKEASGYRSKDHKKFEVLIGNLAAVMQEMPVFRQAKFESGNLSVTLNDRDLSLFNQYSPDFISWNNWLFSKIKSNNAKTLFRKFVELANQGAYQASFPDLRSLLGIQPCYRNTYVVRKLDEAVLQLAPFFRDLKYELKRGRNNEIVAITFSFDKINPQELLAVYSADKYLDNISANLALSETDKQRARALFEKKFLS